MKFIKNNKIWPIAIVIAIMASIIICQNIYLNNQIDKVITEKQYIETQSEETNQILESIKNELNAVYADLDTAHTEIERQSKEIKNKIEEIEKYKKMIEDEEAKWMRRYEEYPIATEAWIALKTLGFNDVTCAGIMGNLMAETGGTGTFNLDWDSNGANGYGLVQWTSGRRNTIKNRYGTYPSVKEQMQFVYDELYGTNGVGRQVTDSQLNKIVNAETPEESAYAFACYYERCGEDYRSMRKGFARKAYEYFVV